MNRKLAVILIIVSLVLATFFIVTHRSPEQETQEETQETESPEQEIQINSWAYQLQQADPKEIASSGFDLIVIDYSYDGTEAGEYSPEEIELIKNSGKIVLAYISIGEAEDYRFYWKDEWKTNPPEWLGKENPEWPGNYPVKFWYDEWKQIVFEYLDRILSQGFQGVYLDKVDVFEYWSDPNNGEGFWLPEDEVAKMMIDFIVEIAKYCRERAGDDFLIVPQNGERLLEYDNGTLLSAISGWAVEDLFFNATERLSENWTEERTVFLDRVKAAGKFVLVVDYVDDGTRSEEDLQRIREFIELARSKGYIPYAAIYDRELDELNVIPGLQPLMSWHFLIFLKFRFLSIFVKQGYPFPVREVAKSFHTSLAFKL